jgi:hypothetical protein
MIEDYSHTLLEQEEMAFNFAVLDVQSALSTFGVKYILDEVVKNPFIKQELKAYLKVLDI